MKAVRLYEYGGAARLIYECDAPEPVRGPGTVLVEIVATSVNPVDWKMRSGALRQLFPLHLPAILGRDVSGIVESVGSDVEAFRPGDRVLAVTRATYAERVSVAAGDLCQLPEGLDGIDSAALPLVSLTGAQLIRRGVRATAGQSILISGALGSVGRAAVHAARKAGLTVFAGVRADQRTEASSLGVDATYAIDDARSIAAIPKVDSVADTVGGATAEALLSRVKDGGNFGHVSYLPPGAADRYPAVSVNLMMSSPDPNVIREFAEDLRDEKWRLPIGRRLPLREAPVAHRLGEAGNAGKIVLLCR